MINPVTDLALGPLQAGGGVWVRWVNPTDHDFDHVLVLRVTGAGPITGPTDPLATAILNGKGAMTPDYRAIFKPDPPLVSGQARQILDITVPNQLYTYAIYASNDDELDVSSGNTGSLTTPDIPLLTEPNVHNILMQYLDDGLARALASGALRIPKKMADQITKIDVVSNSPRIEHVTWPVVSVHLDDDSAAEYALGDVVDSFDLIAGRGLDNIGYISLISFSIGGWAADNPDVRQSLYRVLKGLLMGARQLLTACGVEKLELSGSHREDFQTYDIPMYSAEFHMKAWVVSRVQHPQGLTADTINVTGTVTATSVC